MSFEHFSCTMLVSRNIYDKFHRVTKVMVTFVRDTTFELSFNFKTSSINLGPMPKKERRSKIGVI
jgi:hypothetical protein